MRNINFPLHHIPKRRRPKVSLIIPTLNESENLSLVLPLIPLDWVDEVLLIDGRSTDRTIEIAREILPSIKVVLESTPGKGAALLAGYQASSGDILIVMDADGSNDPREIPRFIHQLLEGADMVKGSRFAPGGGTTDMPRIRKWGNGAFVVISNFLFSKNFTDLCYGYHAFWRHCLNDLNLDNINGFEIDTSLYLQAVRNRFHIVEVPSFEGIRFYGDGKLQTIPDGFRVLRTIGREWLQSPRSAKAPPRIGFRGFLPPAVAADLAFQESRLRAHEQKAEQLLKMAERFLLRNHAIEDVLERIFSFILDLVGAQSGSILLLNEKGDVERALLSYEGGLRELEPQQAKEIIQKGLAGWVIRNREPALVSNTLHDSRWVRREWESNTYPSFRSALSVPVVANGRVSAVLTMVRKGDRQFADNDLMIVKESMDTVYQNTHAI